MPVQPPPPVTTSPISRIRSDLRLERAAFRRAPALPGWQRPSLKLTRQFRRDPLSVLLPAYEEFGPVFGLRLLHAYQVIMLGPEANHFILVSDRDKFHWREGSFGDLIPLIGDGLLTTDGSFHDHARELMLPVFHSERIAAAGEAMSDEVARAVDRLRPGQRIDLYDWTRHLAMRVAMRALFGLDPDATEGFDVAAEFERGLSFYEREYILQILRGPGSPFRRVRRARHMLDGLIEAEIARRRKREEPAEDILSLLIEASDGEGERLSDAQIRDHVLTLLFAGHDTTTSTVSFLFWELSRAPEWRARLIAERDRVIGNAKADATLLFAEMPELSQAVDETLRLYPPAWVGPRRVVADFEFAGHRVPAGLPVSYCSWASHRLPHVFEDPEAFRPERWSAEERAKLPRGAYVPFGGGPRICIGKRFGELEIRVIAAEMLGRYVLEPEPGYEMRVRQMPTLSPKGGLPVFVQPR